MLNAPCTRACAVVSCLTCLAMAVASTARAKDDQNPNQQQKSDQKLTTSPQEAPPSNQQNAEQKPADQQNQQNARTDQHANERLQQNAQRDQSKSKQKAGLGVSITSDKDENGVLVVRILPNTAAQRMGLQRHDRIQSLNGEKVRSADDFIAAISSMNPGARVELKVMRNGNERTIRGELEGYSESVVETQGPSGGHEYRQFRSYIEPKQPSSDHASRNENRDNRDSTQAGSVNRAYSTDSQFSDLEARVARLEQRFEKVAQQIEDLVTNNNHGQTASVQKTGPPNTAKK